MEWEVFRHRGRSWDRVGLCTIVLLALSLKCYGIDNLPFRAAGHDSAGPGIDIEGIGGGCVPGG